jgi:CheY-like chemotaxis protein
LSTDLGVLSVSRRPAVAYNRHLLSTAARILIVDDEPGVVSTLELAFEDSGWDIESAANGTQALEMLRDGKYDLVLMDKNLPDIDGVSIIGIVRANNPHLKFIMMTGYGSVDSAADVSTLGVEAYVEKPFEDVFVVRSLVENALGYDTTETNRQVGQVIARQSESFAGTVGSSPELVPLSGDELLEEARDMRLSIVLASDDSAMLGKLSEHVRNDQISATQYDIDVSAPKTVCTASDVYDVAIFLGGTELVDIVSELRRRSPTTVVFVISVGLPLSEITKLISWQVHSVSKEQVGTDELEKELHRFLRSALALKRAVI